MNRIKTNGMMAAVGSAWSRNELPGTVVFLKRSGLVFVVSSDCSDCSEDSDCSIKILLLPVSVSGSASFVAVSVATMNILHSFRSSLA